MKLISPTDSLFLLGEPREYPMHVAGLQLFEPPADAGPDYVRDSVPHLQRLMGHLEDSLADLERAVGI